MIYGNRLRQVVVGPGQASSRPGIPVCGAGTGCTPTGSKIWQVSMLSA
jgi:hypothetical protein